MAHPSGTQPAVGGWVRSKPPRAQRPWHTPYGSVRGEGVAGCRGASPRRTLFGHPSPETHRRASLWQPLPRRPSSPSPPSSLLLVRRSVHPVPLHIASQFLSQQLTQAFCGSSFPPTASAPPAGLRASTPFHRAFPSRPASPSPFFFAPPWRHHVWPQPCCEAVRVGALSLACGASLVGGRASEPRGLTPGRVLSWATLQPSPAGRGGVGRGLCGGFPLLTFFLLFFSVVAPLTHPCRC